MVCMWEHIYWLNCLHFVQSIKELKIAGLCGWVTADIDNFLRLNLKKLFHDFLVHACAWWVGDDEVRASVGFDEFVGEDFR